MKEQLMNNTQIKEYIDNLVKQQLQNKVPHICSYCGWFLFDKHHKTNRYCRYEGDLNVVRGVCQMWKPAEDMELRVRGNYTV